MELLQRLENLLRRQGYEKGPLGICRIWIRDTGEEIALVALVPELLPGQPAPSQEEIRGYVNSIAAKVMMTAGKRVKDLLIYMERDMPTMARVNEVGTYHNSWFVDRKDRKLLIYEDQIGDFYGLRDQLEQMLAEYDQFEKEKRKEEWKRAFTPVNTLIVLVEILVFVWLSIHGDTLDPEFIWKAGGLTWHDIVDQGEWYRLITCGFLHFGLDHLVHNMLVLAVIGSRLERAEGKLTYLIVFFGSQLCAAASSLFFTLADSPGTVSAGASGAVFGIIGAMLSLVLIDLVQGKEMPARKLGRSGITFRAGFALVAGVMAPEVDNAAHVGGLLGGCIIMIIIRSCKRILKQFRNI